MRSTEEEVEEFLKDLTYSASYEFLEVGKHDEELKRIAEKRGIQLPSEDISIFKAKYAVTDRANRNHCILDRDDVVKALDTLVGKRVTIDHMLKRVVGHFLDAKLEENVIYAYGALFKSSFDEEYEEIKKLMVQGQAGVSFEAYGKRDPQENGNYYLRDIHFAGGAILLTEQPAEPTAHVLELAKLLTPPDKFLHVEEEDKSTMDKKQNVLEQARYYIQDLEVILKLVQEAKKPGSDEPLYASDVVSIDFENSLVVCDAWEPPKKEDDPWKVVRYEINLTPTSRLLEKARTIASIKLTEAVWTCPDCKHKMDEKPKKCPSCDKDMTHKSSDNTEVIDSNKENKSMDDKNKENAEAAPDPKDAELAQLKEQLQAKDKEIAALSEKVVAFEKADRERTLASRRSELGDFAKDMKDEDVLDTAKFEMAKKDKALADKDKEIAELKAKVPQTTEKASANETLETGSADKSTDSEVAKSKRIRQSAFQDNSDDESENK